MTPFSDSMIEEVMPLYPGFTNKAATFSYDDGIYNASKACASDIDLINIFNKYGVKATFNIVGMYADNAESAGKLDVYTSAFDGHEIASHSKTHPEMNKMTLEAAFADIEANNVTLSDAFTQYDSSKYGFVWPYYWPYTLDADGALTAAIRASGAAYIRPTTTTASFDLPTDWYNWEPTSNDTGYYNQGASKNNIVYYTDALIADQTSGLRLMYLWGHSVDLWGTDGLGRNGVNYGVFETCLKKLIDANVWIDTNMAVHDYIEATRSLSVSSDRLTISNPSDVDVYALINGRKTIIPAHSSAGL